jgi:hypothetical protein
LNLETPVERARAGRDALGWQGAKRIDVPDKCRGSPLAGEPALLVPTSLVLRLLMRADTDSRSIAWESRSP